MTQFRKVIILCPHAAVVESAYTADLKSAPKGYGFKSRQRHHVGSGALHAAAEQKARPFARRLCIRFLDPPFRSEAVCQPRFCVSFRRRTSLRRCSPSPYPRLHSRLSKAKLYCSFAFVLREDRRGDSRIARAAWAKPFCRPSANPHRTHAFPLRGRWHPASPASRMTDEVKTPSFR